MFRLWKRKQKHEHSLNIGYAVDRCGSIVGILGFGGISASAIYNFITKSWKSGWWTVLLLVGVLTCVFWALHFARKHYRKFAVWVLNLFAKKLPYSLKRWEIKYEYLTPTEMQYEALFQVKALQTGVDHIRVRYNWSGATEQNPIFPEPIVGGSFHTKRIESDGSEFGYNFYKVFSNAVINEEDEPILLGVRIRNLIEKGKKASPHLLTNVNVITDLLVMTVLLPSDILPENIEFLEYIHATDDCHWHRYVEGDNHDIVKVETTPENKKKILWEVKDPIIGGKYIIRWHPSK